MKKINKALVKRTLKYMEILEELLCQKYSKGRCRDFAAIEAELCSACQIREGALMIKQGAKKYNPQQIIF